MNLKLVPTLIRDTIILLSLKHNYAAFIHNCISLHDWEGNIGKYSIEINRIGLTKGRDDIEVENGIFPILPDKKNYNNIFPHRYRHGQ